MSSSHTHEPTRVRVTDWGRTADDGTLDFLLVEQRIDQQRRDVEWQKRFAPYDHALRQRRQKLADKIHALQAQLDSLNTPAGADRYRENLRQVDRRKQRDTADQQRHLAEQQRRANEHRQQTGARKHMIDLAGAFELLPPFLFINWRHDLAKKQRLAELGYITKTSAPGEPSTYSLYTPQEVVDTAQRLYPNGLPA